MPALLCVEAHVLPCAGLKYLQLGPWQTAKALRFPLPPSLLSSFDCCRVCVFSCCIQFLVCAYLYSFWYWSPTACKWCALNVRVSVCRFPSREGLYTRGAATRTDTPLRFTLPLFRFVLSHCARAYLFDFAGFVLVFVWGSFGGPGRDI